MVEASFFGYLQCILIFVVYINNYCGLQRMSRIIIKPIPRDRPEKTTFPSFASGNPWLQAGFIVTPIVTQPAGKSNENFRAGYTVKKSCRF
jgi:hypothetical protein